MTDDSFITCFAAIYTFLCIKNSAQDPNPGRCKATITCGTQMIGANTEVVETIFDQSPAYQQSKKLLENSVCHLTQKMHGFTWFRRASFKTWLNVRLTEFSSLVGSCTCKTGAKALFSNASKTLQATQCVTINQGETREWFSCRAAAADWSWLVQRCCNLSFVQRKQFQNMVQVCKVKSDRIHCHPISTTLPNASGNIMKCFAHELVLLRLRYTFSTLYVMTLLLKEILRELRSICMNVQIF